MKITYLKDSRLATKFTDLKFKGLLELTPKWNGKPPRPETLEASGMPRLVETSNGDITLTVYAEGLCLFRQGEEATAFAVWKCRLLPPEYLSVDGGRLSEDMAGEMPWYFPLLLAGMNRAEHNADSREEYRCDFHFSSETEDWTTMPSIPDIADEIIAKEDKAERVERLNETLPLLSARQWQIIEMVSYRGMAHRAAARELGITKGSVTKIYGQAIKKLRKNF